MTSIEEPVACTLSAHDAESQLLEWADLQELALRSQPLLTGARIAFPASHRVKIEDLAARETACCAFLDLSTTVQGDELLLEITSNNPDALGVIDALSGVQR